nr:flagellar hook protein FlgE [uncultured Sphingomonas sp.]
MSLYSALYAGASGLGAQSTAMAGVADNITNINTIGYKGVATEFRTLVTSGGMKSQYSAGGVAAAPQALISKQGLIQASSSNTDLAIDGAGFFVVRSGTGADSDVAFTRAGAFKPDVMGFLRNTSGYYLQGWKLDPTGNYVDTGLNSLQSVRLSDLTGSASATSRLQLRANLQSDAPVLAGAYAVGDIATGTVAPHFQRSFDIYDAQGSAHRISVGFVKTAPNEWQAEIFAVPATDVTAADGVLASGTVRFNPDGSLDLAGSSAAFFADLTPTWTNGAGAQPIDLQLGSDGKLDGLIQFSGASAVISSTVDGGVLGNLASIEVDEKGVVSAIFDDGTSRKVYQLPVATVLNPDGMNRLNGNAFGLSSASGAVAINPPGALGSGMISSASLEGSNVDLANEFTNMIRFQRAYSASSKIITTVDDMLQELSNLKR